MLISVVPLRYDTGNKGKISTSIAASMTVGLPVVGTSLATKDMLLTDEKHILIADGTENFVNTLTRIYKDEVLWNHISQNSQRFAEQQWRAETAWQILAKTLADLDIEVERSAYPLSLYSELPLTNKLIEVAIT